VLSQLWKILGTQKDSTGGGLAQLVSILLDRYRQRNVLAAQFR